MKRLILFGLLLVLCISILAACGSSNNPASTGSSSNSNTIHGATNTPSAVKRQVVLVTLVDYKILPAITTFHVGVPYQFVVTNKGKVDHMFMIAPPMSDSMMMSNMYGSALAYLIDVAPGQTLTLNYTFSKASSHLEFASHFSGHGFSGSQYDLGMHTSIIVV
jgi:uncharacterized cupredoxin-like copper-binding protein